MASRMRFMYNNLLDAAGVVITPLTESSTLPASNLVNELKTKVYRCGTSAVLERVVFDLLSAKDFTCVMLLNHNLTSSDSLIALEANATDSWSSPSFSQALTHDADTIAAYFTSENYRYISFTYTKSASGETRDIGRLFVGEYYEATQNFTPDGVSIQEVDLSKTSRSDGGQEYTDVRDTYHKISASFEMIGDTQNEQFKTITQAVGKHTPFFISLHHDVKPVDWIYYVKFASLPSFKPKFAATTPYWSLTLPFNEQL